jgi:PAS domain S-box-containing protein
MNPLKERRLINITFVIALLLVLSINILIYLFTREYIQDHRNAFNTLLIIQTSEKLLSAITDAETNRRGYLITNNEEFLGEYTNALKSVDSIYISLNELIKDNPEIKGIVDSLKPVLLNRQDILEESIILQEKRLKGMREQVRFTELGKQTQDKIKTLIKKLQDIESQKVIAGVQKADESSSSTFTYVITGTVISVILMLVGIILLNKKIADRLKFEAALEKSRNWFSTTLMCIGDAVIVTDKFGAVSFMNHIAEQLTEWKEEQVKGLFLENVFHVINEDTRERIDNPISRVFREGTIVGLANHSVLISRSGKEIAIDDSASPIVDEERNIIGAVLIFRDITEKRKVEKTLIENRRFIQRVTDSIPNALYIYDIKNLKLTYTNKKIQEMLGYTEEYARSRGYNFFLENILPDDFKRLKASFRRYAEAEDDEVIENEFRIRNLKEEYRWLHSFEVVFSRDEKRQPLQILGSALDVTEKKILEEELVKYRFHLEELVQKRTHELQITNERLRNEIIERVRAQKSIAEAEEKFRNLVEYSFSGIYIIQDFKYLYVNPKYEQIFGYEPGELIGKNVLDVVYEEDREFSEASIRKRMKGETKTAQYTFRGIRKDKQIIYVEVIGSSMDLDGNIAIIGTLQDVTERKKVEDEIRAWNEKYNVIVESSAAMVYDYNVLDGSIEWGGSIKKILGYIPEEMSGGITQWENMIHSEDREFALGMLKDAETNHQPYNVEYRFKHKNGSYVWFVDRGFFIYDSRGRAVQMLGMMQDITVMKHVQETLESQRKFLRTVIDTNPGFIFAKDWEGRFTLVNKAVADTYGTTVEDLIGKTDADFNPNKEEVEHFLHDDREVMMTGKPKLIPEEPVYNAKTGEDRWYQTYKIPLKSEGGDIQVLGVSTDITERKNAENKIVKSLKEKELLLQEIHHRVKNNLQIIISLLKLQSNFVYDTRDLDLFNKSEARVKTMSLIHEKLYKSSDLTNIDMGSYVRDLASQLAKAYGVNTSLIKISAKIGDIQLGIDTAIPIGLIINELIANALKYAFPDGRKGCIEIIIEKKEDRLILVIADDGIGLPNEIILDTAQSFGLNLVNTLVKQLSASIVVEKEIGTKYTIVCKELKYKERI